MALRVACLLVGLLLSFPTTAGANARSQLLYGRGLIPFQQENWEPAYRLFEQAVSADASDALATYYRGLAAARLGLWNVALQSLESALRLQPDIPRAALDLGIIHFELGQFDAAEKWFEEASRQPCCQFSGALFRGLTRYRLGDDTAAVEFLRQAEQEPELKPTALYYQGLAFLRQGENERARDILATLVDGSPQSEVGRVAARYLSEVPAARRGLRGSAAAGMVRPWSLGVEAGFEYDSNVVLAPDDEDIESTRGISDEADGRFRVGLGGQYRVPTRESLSVTLGYDFSQSVHFNLTEFDLQGHDLRVDVSAPWQGVEVGVTGGYDFYALNYRSFFQQGTASPWLTFFEGDRASTRLYYSLRGRDYFRDPFEPYLDALNHAFGIHQIYSRPEGKGVFSAGYHLDFDDPVSDDGEEFEYLAHRLNLGYACPLRDWVDLEAGYAFRIEDYESVNSRTGTEVTPTGTRRRHDNEHQFALRFERDLSERWTAALFYVGVMNGSNIDAFEYGRNIIAANLRYEF